MFTKLHRRGVLKLEGPDTASLLQGLVTQDMALLDRQASLYTCLLTPQGKIMFDFFVFRIKDIYLIDCAGIDLEPLATRLNMYKLRSDVSITDETAHYCVVVANEVKPDLPADPRCDVLGARLIMPLHEAENAGSDDAPYHSARLKAGIAEGPEIAGSQFFPHECNLDQLNGISFTKGCYVGQEVVSRMEHKTIVRKRILPYHFSGVGTEKGALITCDEQKLGVNITSLGTQGLAMIRLDRLDAHSPDTPVLMGEEEITLYKPSWAKFSTTRLSEVS